MSQESEESEHEPHRTSQEIVLGNSQTHHEYEIVRCQASDPLAGIGRQRCQIRRFSLNWEAPLQAP